VLEHDPDAFTEAFHGGNIIEAKAGEVFEADVVDVVKSETDTFYNINTVSLVEAANLIPDVGSEKIKQIDNSVKREGIENGEFECNGVSGRDIVLGDVETVYDDSVEMNKNAVKNLFYAMQVAYTEALLEEILGKNTREYVEPEARSETSPIVLFQATFKTQIRDWWFAGDADLIFIWPSDDPTVHVVDVKMATEEQTDHQLQTTVYANALKEILSKMGDWVSLDAGVLTSVSDFVPLERGNISSFNLASREEDIIRYTKEGGVFDAVYESEYEDIGFQLNNKCSTCQYNEACYSMAIENTGLELLGIDRGTQKKLRQNGVHDLNDLAALAEPPNEYVHPDKDSKPQSTKQHRETYQQLSNIPGLGEQLPHLIQKAQGLLQNINPDNKYTNQTGDAQLITNTGYGSLPSDRAFFNTEQEYKPGSMIRVYVNVQFDHIRDVINAVGFTACATASTTDEVTRVVFDESQPDDMIQAKQNEEELLNKFSENVIDAIKKIHHGIDFNGYDQNNPFIHFYTYSENEKQILQERLATYSSGNVTIDATVNNKKYGDGSTREFSVDPNDELLGVWDMVTKQSNKDEQNVSVVLNDIEKRVAIREPSTGIINVYKEFYTDTEDQFTVNDWKYTVNNHTTGQVDDERDLTDVFGYRFFNNSVGYSEDNNSITLDHEGKISTYDGWLNSRLREAAQIPIAYLWSATGKLEQLIDADNTHTGIPVKPFMYRNVDEEEKIQTVDIEVLIDRLTKCLRHIERGIPKKGVIELPEQKEQPGAKNDERVEQ
jgi:phenylpyruvate tautomerase PptA (4-oxalocrotonate tautomerase family)